MTEQLKVKTCKKSPPKTWRGKMRRLKHYMTWQLVQEIKNEHTKLATYSHTMEQTGRLKP